MLSEVASSAAQTRRSRSIPTIGATDVRTPPVQIELVIDEIPRSAF